jgi:hypothetical protein
MDKRTLLFTAITTHLALSCRLQETNLGLAGVRDSHLRQRPAQEDSSARHEAVCMGARPLGAARMAAAHLAPGLRPSRRRAVAGVGTAQSISRQPVAVWLPGLRVLAALVHGGGRHEEGQSPVRRRLCGGRARGARGLQLARGQ